MTLIYNKRNWKVPSQNKLVSSTRNERRTKICGKPIRLFQTLKLLECLFVLWTSGFRNFDDIEWYCFTQGSTLTNSYDISNIHISASVNKHKVNSPEARRYMYRHILMSLLISVVLFHVLEVVTTNNNSPVHLHFTHNTCEDSTTDTYISSEGTLLVNVITEYSLFWSFVAKTYALVIPSAVLSFHFLLLKCVFSLEINNLRDLQLTCSAMPR